MKSLLTKTPFYRALRPLVSSVRHRRFPDLLDGFEYVTVTCNGQERRLQVGRWEAEHRMAVKQCFADRQYDLGDEVGSGPYNQWSQACYDRIVASKKRPLIVDCGANIGASVAWFSMRYPKARIVAIEPEAQNFRALEQNAKAADAELIRGGIGPRTTQARVMNPGATSLGVNLCDDAAGDIRIYPLDELLAAHTTSEDVPFLLKIDIEGSERELFSGDTSSFAQFPVIVIEPHDWMFPDTGTIRGFLHFHLSQQRDLAIRHENLVSLSPGLLLGKPEIP